MFGKIIEMEDNVVVIENLSTPTANYINYHVAFNEENRKVIGEIVSIKEKEIKVLLVGEVKDDVFYAGVLKKPNFTTIARLVYKSEVELFLGNQDISSKNNLYIGKSNTYEGFNVCADLNDFFANHFAIIGNTGSGKSCGVAKIIQNLFYHNDTVLPLNAHLVLFDVYGEYNTAFQDLNKIPGISYNNLTTNLDFSEGEVLFTGFE